MSFLLNSIFKKTLTSVFKNGSASLHTCPALCTLPLHYPNHKMERDVKVRKQVKANHFERTNLIALKRAKILPYEIRDIAAERLHAMPLDNNYTRMAARCRITSRPRGRVRQWKVSRIIFRQLADYNKLSGMQRALFT